MFFVLPATLFALTVAVTASTFKKYHWYLLVGAATLPVEFLSQLADG